MSDDTNVTATDLPAIGETRFGILKSFNKGGYVVAIDGTTCFCPSSEMYPKVLSPQDLGTMQHGPGVEYKVMHVRGGSPVVSRKEAVVDGYRKIVRAAFEGRQPLDGVVSKVVRTGAFVEVGGGVAGFLHLKVYARGSQMKD